MSWKITDTTFRPRNQSVKSILQKKPQFWQLSDLGESLRGEQKKWFQSRFYKNVNKLRIWLLSLAIKLRSDSRGFWSQNYIILRPPSLSKWTLCVIGPWSLKSYSVNWFDNRWLIVPPREYLINYQRGSSLTKLCPAWMASIHSVRSDLFILTSSLCRRCKNLRRDQRQNWCFV